MPHLDWTMCTQKSRHRSRFISYHDWECICEKWIFTLASNNFCISPPFLDINENDNLRFSQFSIACSHIIPYPPILKGIWTKEAPTHSHCRTFSSNAFHASRWMSFNSSKENQLSISHNHWPTRFSLQLFLCKILCNSVRNYWCSWDPQFISGGAMY